MGILGGKCLYEYMGVWNWRLKGYVLHEISCDMGDDAL